MKNVLPRPRIARRLSVAAAGCAALMALSAAPGTASAAPDPVTAGIPYYLVAAEFDRGLTSGKGSGGDFVRFADRAGQYGQSLTFEKKNGGGPYGAGYVIRMNRPAQPGRGNENTLCHGYGRIALTSDANCRMNPWVVEAKGDRFLLKTRWDGEYLYLAASGAIDGDKALYAKSRYADDGRRFVEFKAVPADQADEAAGAGVRPS
ncbi:hypothetical protein [Streptomyces sp. NPDC053048]|uniref:hypothetical protein n=1 Tax=Streptomyces sp. NPDC053048 TaxID=3365694 RepID=UPI0037D8D683